VQAPRNHVFLVLFWGRSLLPTHPREGPQGDRLDHTREYSPPTSGDRLASVATAEGRRGLNDVELGPGGWRMTPGNFIELLPGGAEPMEPFNLTVPAL